MDELKQSIRLSDDEIAAYLAWAEVLQQKHADECDGPLDSMTISFQFSPFGIQVIGHAAPIPEDAPQVLLRSDW